VKNRKCRKVFAWGGSLAAILMLLVGVVMIYKVLYTYNGVVLSNQDSQMLNWARVLDHNVSETFIGYKEELADVTRRKGMQRTLNLFLNQNESDEFIARLSENLVSGDPLIEALLVEQEGNILISSNGKTDYRMTKSEGINGIYTDADGDYYVAFREPAEPVDYVALFNLERYYNHLMEALPVKTDRLMLMDPKNNLLVHRWNGTTRVDRIEDLNTSNCDYDGYKAMADSFVSGKTGVISYSFDQSGETYNARLAVLPAQQTRNGQLTLALAVNADAIVKPLEKGALQLMLFCAMAVLGAIIIVAKLIHAALKDRKTANELRLLREKNAEMEKLTNKTLELAHHQRLETIGTLTSSIAHEFNNLLTPIMGYSMMSLEKLSPDNEELNENLLEIYNASRKAKVMISRLNELSRKGSENVNNEIKIDDFVRKVMAAAHPAKPKQVQTEMMLNGGEHCIFGNELQLTQMMLNLVLNAFQAMETKVGVVAIETSIDNGTAVIRLKDQGTGIAKENLSSIFEPFFTTKESGKGTGLGLAIAQQAVEAHNGRIEVESEIGKGTVFTVYLPLAD